MVDFQIRTRSMTSIIQEISSITDHFWLSLFQETVCDTWKSIFILKMYFAAYLGVADERDVKQILSSFCSNRPCNGKWLNLRPGLLWWENIRNHIQLWCSTKVAVLKLVERFLVCVIKLRWSTQMSICYANHASLKEVNHLLFNC